MLRPFVSQIRHTKNSAMQPPLGPGPSTDQPLSHNHEPTPSENVLLHHAFNFPSVHTPRHVKILPEPFLLRRRSTHLLRWLGPEKARPTFCARQRQTRQKKRAMPAVTSTSAAGGTRSNAQNIFYFLNRPLDTSPTAPSTQNHLPQCKPSGGTAGNSVIVRNQLLRRSKHRANRSGSMRFPRMPAKHGGKTASVVVREKTLGWVGRWSGASSTASYL